MSGENQGPSSLINENTYPKGHFLNAERYQRSTRNRCYDPRKQLQQEYKGLYYKNDNPNKNKTPPVDIIM